MNIQAFELNQPERELVGKLADLLPLGKREVWSGLVTYYDTFDWRLYRGSWTLTSEVSSAEDWLVLRSLEEDRTYRVRFQEAPGFIASLPKGLIRSELDPLLKMRRLLPLVEIKCSRRSYRLLNADQKTLAYLHFVRGRARTPGRTRYAGELRALLELEPVTGYAKDFSELRSAIEGLTPLVPAPTALERALNCLGRAPLDYSSKLAVELTPEMPAAQAVREIYTALLATMLSNEAGTKEDLDSEFLHDFRVAVRRTRAGLTQLKGVLPREITDHFKAEFSWLGKVTGPTRDMDVYLLEYPNYLAGLPRAVGTDLEPLKTFLMEHHRVEQALLVRALKSRRFRKLVQDWKRFLASEIEAESSPGKAGLPIKQLASERIWKVFQQILRKGRKIDESSPAEALHKIRLDCKKLRYLLEFFNCLYDPAEMKRLIKVLKVLQDNLGGFNDCQVQRLKLRGFARQMMEEGDVGAGTLLAMGRLVERLEIRQGTLRSDFSRHFARFSSAGSSESFRILFAPPEG